MSLTVDLGAAQKAEDKFQSLYDSGAFEHKPVPEPQAAAPEPASKSEASLPEVEAPAPEAADEPEYLNLEDYLTKSNLDRESFYDLPARVKVDGKESDIPLKDILKSYQLEQHVQQKSISLSEKQRAWEAEQTSIKAALKQSLDDAQTLGTLAHQQLLSEFQGIDWNKLRIENPTEWAVRNTEFNQRANAIQNHLAQVKQKQDQLSAEQQKTQGETLARERDKMYDARPEWRDEKVFKSAREEMSTYARHLGFTDAELGGIYDHRYMQVLHDAARYAALQAKAPEVAKRVRTAPKTASPGARTTRDPNAVAAQQAKERFLKNPKDIDAQTAYFERLAG